MKHCKLEEVAVLIKANIPVLLHGERGTGKTTLIKQVAETLKLDFYAVSCTRQTTLSYLLGFMSVNQVYVPSLLRKAVEGGGIYLLDELDAADPNVMLALNTLENGFLAFPDKVVECHEDFRLVATANPFNSQERYTGRAALDAATLDRFDKVEVPYDSKLERSLVSEKTFNAIHNVREAVKSANVALHISMRDAIRLDKRTKLNLGNNYVRSVLLADYPEIVLAGTTEEPYGESCTGKLQEHAKDVHELWNILKSQATYPQET